MGRIRVYIACSLDGFIAGVNDDLTWLEEVDPEAPVTGEGLQFDAFMADVGALLMGRGTYDVVAGMHQWFYGDTPVLVASHRDLLPVKPTVRAVSGGIDDLLDQALDAARGKDVYVDGGVMIRQALDAGRVDELVVTFIPVVLGAGHPLFAGVQQRHGFHLDTVQSFRGGAAQLILRPRR